MLAKEGLLWWQNRARHPSPVLKPTCAETTNMLRHLIIACCEHVEWRFYVELED